MIHKKIGAMIIAFTFIFLVVNSSFSTANNQIEVTQMNQILASIENLNTATYTTSTDILRTTNPDDLIVGLNGPGIDDDIIILNKRVKPGCDYELYEESISINYDEYEFVTYRIDILINNSADEHIINLHIRDNLPQLDGLSYNNSYVKNKLGQYISPSKYDFTMTNQYLYWNFSYENITLNTGTILSIFYCADIIGCGEYENDVNVSGFYYNGGPCCPEWTYANDSALVDIICPSGVSMDKRVSLDGIHWVDTGVETFIDDIIWFKLRIKNIDTENPVEGVNVYDILPDYLILEEVVDRDGATIIMENDHELRWFYSLLDPSEIREIIFKARVKSFGDDINLACVYECDDGEWCDEVWIDVSDGMFVDKQVSLDETTWLENVSAVPGDEVFWNITISYYDSSIPPLVLYHIIINDTLPKNVSYVNNSGKIIKSDGWNINLNPEIHNSVLTWDLTSYENNCTLLNGTWLSVLFSTSIDEDATGLLENRVNVSAYRCDGTKLFKKDNATVYIQEIINHKPILLNPLPEPNAENVSIDATLQIDVNDTDDDLLTVIFYDASDDSVIKSHSSVNTPKTLTASWNNLEYNTTYAWYVTADDGIITVQTKNYSFTTEQEPDNLPPEILEDSPTPENGATDVIINPWIAVHVADPNEEDTIEVKFYKSDGSLIGEDSCTSDCTATIKWANLEYDTTYSWYVTVSDGIEEIRGPASGFWRFTTETIDIELNIALKGGLGVTLDIENSGADTATEIAWTIDVQSRGIFGRIDEKDGDIIPLIGSEVTSSVTLSIFAIGRVTITGTAACDYAEPQEIIKNGFILGPFVIIRS